MASHYEKILMRVITARKTAQLTCIEVSHEMFRTLVESNEVIALGSRPGLD